MMNQSALPAPARRVSYLCALAALTLLVILVQARATRAQWAQPPGSNNINNTNTGNVGVGTSTPGAKLDVTFNGAAEAGLKVFDTRPAGVDFGGHLLFFGNSNGGTMPVRFGQIGGLKENSTQGSMLGYLGFYTNNGATTFSVVERMRINSAGNVGIGTATPAERLHVVGNLKVDGNIEAKYQDVAEWVPTTQGLAAGTVVVLDSHRPNHVLASSLPYDTSVAGVVSAQPGLILGEGGEGRVKVATTGRVRVRVDATKGPIKIGDLLVTSDVPGVAMRSEPITVGGRLIHTPGTIIGKALEPLAGGVGEILVLLSLQ